MEVIEELKRPLRAIVHFAEDQKIAERNGARYPLFQVEFDPDPQYYSPCGNFVRFEHGMSEIHGWVHVDSILVDTVLEEYFEETDEWVKVKEPVPVIQIVRQSKEVAHG